MIFKKSAQTQFLDRLKGSPVVQQAMREIETQELGDRQALINELEALGATLRTFTTMRAAREVEINAEILTVEKRRNELGAELNALDAAGSNLRSTSNREFAALKAQIKAGADPRINNFVIWVQYAYQQAAAIAAKENAGFVMLPEEDMQASGKRALAAWKRTADALNELGAMVNSCLARAEQMRMEVATSFDVNTELQSMVAGLLAKYASHPRPTPLVTNYLGTIPGVVVIDINEMNEAVQ